MTEEGKNIIVTTEVVNIPAVEPRKHVYVYFFQDGGVVKLAESKPDAVCLDQCYMAMVSVPGTGSSAPYVEIIKAALGTAALVLTADVPITNVIKAPPKKRKPMKPECCEGCDAMTFDLQRGAFEDGRMHWLCDACRFKAGVYALEAIGSANWDGFLAHLKEVKK